MPPGADVTTGNAERTVKTLATAPVPAGIEPESEEESHAGSGINIVWTNRGPGDGFDTIFGGGAATDLARANVDAAIDAWEQVITTLNRPSTPGDDTLDITVNMNPGATATSCGGSASGNFDGDGWPTGGAINVNGNANVWFIDPDPLEHSEFTGNIDNAFSGDAQTGSPAAGLCDMFTLVGSEIIHILGITSNGGSRFQTGGFNTQLTNTGTTCSGPGDLWQFTGATITALMTSNNGGTGGTDFGVPVHTAEPCASAAGLSGANDGGNAIFEGSRRYLPSNLVAFILRDTYNYGVVAPETFGTFYSVLDTSTGDLLVRGGDDNDNSDDVISLTTSGDEIVSSVDAGNDIPGTGPTDAFVSRFDEGEVLTKTINAFDGDDTIHAGPGLSTVADGTGNDLVDLSENAVAINYTTDGGNDTVIGTVFDDTITGSGGTDTFFAGEGNDTLIGAGGGDNLFGQEGSDLFIWNSGDGSDLIEGGIGVNDALQLNADGSNDLFDMGATPGSRVQLGDPFGFNLDMADVEDFELNLDGGNDDLSVNDLSTTAASSIEIDLGSGADTVTVFGTGVDDVLGADPLGIIVDVSGLPYSVEISSTGSDDTLKLDGSAGNDTVVVNGTSAADVITVDNLAEDGARVDGAASPTVLADSAELLVIDGQAGNDQLVVETPFGANTATLSPGVAPDQGTIQVAGLIPLDYRQIPTSLEFDDPGGRTDRLIYEGTTGSDVFDIQSGSGVIGLNDQTPVTPTGIADLELRGLAADDTFDAASVLPFTTTLVDGGDSVAGDALALTGAAGAVSVDFETAQIIGYGGTVEMARIEDLATSQTGAGGTDLTVLGTAGDDSVVYTPTGPDSGLVDGLEPSLSFAGTAGTFTLDPVGGNDDVTVLGTNGSDTVVVEASPTTSVQVNATLTAHIPQASTEIVSVESGEGADFIDLTTFDNVSAFFEVDGGSPESKQNSDEMNVTNGTGSPPDVKFSDVKSFVKGTGSVIAEYRNAGEVTVIDYISIEKIRFFR
jgi:hypothetical protein